MEVHTALGPGLREKPYENALAIELRESGLACIQQPRYPISYRNQIVGECIPDIVVLGSVVIDIKTVESIGDAEIAQVLNYLRISGKPRGLVLNFKLPRLGIKRVSL